MEISANYLKIRLRNKDRKIQKFYRILLLLNLVLKELKTLNTLGFILGLLSLLLQGLKDFFLFNSLFNC